MNATTAWALCLLLAAGGEARAQDVDRAATFGTPTASDGGTAVLQPTQPIDAQLHPAHMVLHVAEIGPGIGLDARQLLARELQCDLAHRVEDAV